MKTMRKWDDPKVGQEKVCACLSIGSYKIKREEKSRTRLRKGCVKELSLKRKIFMKKYLVVVERRRGPKNENYIFHFIFFLFFFYNFHFPKISILS